MSVEDIYNFIRIDDCTATAGQPTAEQFREARQACFEVVVNLAPDGLDTSLPGEGDLLHDLGIEYNHIPVAWTEPKISEFELFEGLMESTHARRVLIHCQANFPGYGVLRHVRNFEARLVR